MKSPRDLLFPPMMAVWSQTKQSPTLAPTPHSRSRLMVGEEGVLIQPYTRGPRLASCTMMERKEGRDQPSGRLETNRGSSTHRPLIEIQELWKTRFHINNLIRVLQI